MTVTVLNLVLPANHIPVATAESKNEELVMRILDSEDIRTKLESIYVQRVYESLRRKDLT